MELIPKVLVAGLFVPPPGVPGGTQVSVDRLNRIWSELAPMYSYRSLQMTPDGNSAEIIGEGGDDAVIIQPPLLQIRDRIAFTPAQSAEKAQSILKVIARHLGVNQFFNFAVRHVYHAPAPENDGRAFVLHRLLGKTEDDLGELQIGGAIWAGIKFVASVEGAQATLLIEPLQREEKLLFIDLDYQFPGPLTALDDVSKRAADAETYMKQAVAQYLDRH